ncbi:MAG: hypothetical protein U0Z44_06720 [Kouleothrix sp.]
MYAPDQVWYADDVFTISHRWLYDYAAELKRRALKLPFETISRADRMMKDDVLKTLAEMGCYRIWIGAESGSQLTFDAMQRGVKVESRSRPLLPSATASRWVCSSRMGATRRAARGYRGDDEQVKKWNPNLFLTTVAYPINTPYYAGVDQGDRDQAVWSAGTDRDFVIMAAIRVCYYKQCWTAGCATRWRRSGSSTRTRRGGRTEY